MEIIRRKPGSVKAKRIIPPIEYELKPITKRLCTFDTETDPFMVGRIPKPFTCGFYIVDSQEYFDFWGDDCINQFFQFLDANFAEGELLIMCHNFGNFDAYFCLDHMDSNSKPFIINGRLGKLFMHGHEFRDSYLNIPVALGNMGEGVKLEVDYAKFERDVREDHKEEIRIYQKQDCVGLGEYVSNWFAMFGDKLTMASAALPMLRSMHGFETIPEFMDTGLRPYYFGGRNQCFETGILKSDWKIYDVHSMYPSVMADDKHPISGVPIYQTKITDSTCFAHIRAWSNGALPVRSKDGGLEFPIGVNDFFAGIHEIRAGIETGTLHIRKVYQAITFEVMVSFAEFIERFYNLRMEAKANKDAILTLFYKLVMNSSYGKLAQDPRKYENYMFDPDEMPLPFRCYTCSTAIEETGACDVDSCDSCKSKLSSPIGWQIVSYRDGKAIWSRPQGIVQGGKIVNRGFFNVATAASITSAARAKLLRGICSSKRPIYCDTDSIICEEIGGNLDLTPNKLGAWGLEATGDTAAIGGKKMYAVFNDGEEIKKASKGVRLGAEEIVRVANGDVVEYANPVPKFQFQKEGEVMWINREIKRTG